MTDITFEDILINFGFGTKEEKYLVLSQNADKKIYMDLTCFDPAEFYDKFPQLKGAFSALFCHENKKIEIHFRDKDPRLVTKMEELGFGLIETSILSCGFVYPRTIVQIINEAHYALSEGVASKEDINRAMKFGVNYPKGPFEWSEGKEIIVKTLLGELFTKTKDKRYIPCPLLDT